MSGLFCQRHGEYSHSGVCRWCEPPEEAAKVIKALYHGDVPRITVPTVRVPLDPFGQPLILSCGHYGFPHGFNRANLAVGPWPDCKCKAYLSRDNLPWFDEQGVRHTPSGCA